MARNKRFIICGLSRLTVRLTRELVAVRAEVTVIRMTGANDFLAGLIEAPAILLEADANKPSDTLFAAGVGGADCVLVLSDGDLENLRAVAFVRKIAPDIPIVIRTFDPVLADQLESGLNIRRAYSVSALATPAFAAAAIGDDVLETLRIGDNETPIIRLTVRDGSPLAGLSVMDINTRHQCALLARSGPEGIWNPVSGLSAETEIAVGEEIVIGGLLTDALGICALNSGMRTKRGHRAGRKRRSLKQNAGRPLLSTRLPVVAAGLVTVLIAAVFVFAHMLRLSMVDAVYFVVTTATTTGYGDISLHNTPDWVKIFGELVMLSGGALLAILFSYMTAQVTADRLDEIMGKRAERMRGHVIVAGLGNTGYRLVRLLTELGIATSVIELSPNARFLGSARARCPVVIGDARLTDDLLRAGVAECRAVVACTDNDLVNIQACLHARRENKDAKTVARIFDDILAERLTDAFDIDKALSASGVATSAFFGAATDERAYRSIHLGNLKLLALRYTVEQPISQEIIETWRANGIRILAYRRQSESPQAPSVELGPLEIGDEIALCGPEEAIRQMLPD